MTEIAITKKVYFKDSSNGVLGNQFTQLINNQENVEETELSVDDFFVQYDKIFYQINKTGDTNSHQYILEREAEYLGVKLSDDIDVQALLEEITSLRQELLDSQTLINDLTKNNV